MRKLLTVLFLAVLALAIFVQPTIGVQGHVDQGVSAIVQVDAPVAFVDSGGVMSPLAVHSDSMLLNDYIYIAAPTAFVTRADDTYNIHALTALGASAMNTTATTNTTESTVTDGSAFHLLV